MKKKTKQDFDSITKELAGDMADALAAATIKYDARVPEPQRPVVFQIALAGVIAGFFGDDTQEFLDFISESIEEE